MRKTILTTDCILLLLLLLRLFLLPANGLGSLSGTNHTVTSCCHYGFALPRIND